MKNKIKNPMELYSEKVNKNVVDVLKEIVNHDLFTSDDKVQRLYCLFCEMHSDWKKSLHINSENRKLYE